eukprot:TRINITY_DN3991_c0_g1_i1.p1 TRINITY_DN3991_c0_g1~~TRINITY_DN3991_c0_g1_i1.p1  ORF type:complete len:290 (+),score=54.47 TRINITY_DN3991_c0_g1_i1:33-872(+)
MKRTLLECGFTLASGAKRSSLPPNAAPTIVVSDSDEDEADEETPSGIYHAEERVDDEPQPDGPSIEAVVPQYTLLRLPGATVYFFPRFLSRGIADRLLHHLLPMPWEQHDVVLFGKRMQENRKTLFFADATDCVYSYAGRDCMPKPFTPELLEVKALVEKALPDGAVCFNACLLNLYENGTRSIGMHSDDEKSLRPGTPIASLSLGATRFFDIKPIAHAGSVVPPRQAKSRLTLAHGCMVLMAGDTQKNYKHGVPVQKSVMAPRVNLTFRCVTNVRSAR